MRKAAAQSALSRSWPPGRLGGYGGNLELNARSCVAEGLHVTGSTIRNFAVRRWPSVLREHKRRRLRQVS